MDKAKQPKRLPAIGRDLAGPYFSCCGPDLLTFRCDLNNALSVVKFPKQIELAGIHSKRAIVKGKREVLEMLQAYLVTRERYAQQ